VASLKAAADTLKEFGDKLPPEKVSALMTIIALESNYFKELVDNLFFLATLDSPKFTTDFEQFDLGEIISEEVALLRRKLDGKIALESRLETEVIHVRGHAIMLRRLLRNVLENAAKYGSTRVSLTVREDARSYILTVEDDGPGMTEDDLKKFGTKKISRKVSAVSPSEAVSLGIGSVIILEIAKFHDAELVVANVTLGKGVIVTLRLPK
jgi:K+-sensing histidine kinase KdpD